MCGASVLDHLKHTRNVQGGSDWCCGFILGCRFLYFVGRAFRAADSFGSSSRNERSRTGGDSHSPGLTPFRHRRHAPEGVDLLHSSSVFYDQGLSYLHSYVWIEAARSFHQALRADPNLAMSYVELADAYIGLQDIPSARAACNKAAAL